MQSKRTALVALFLLPSCLHEKLKEIQRELDENTDKVNRENCVVLLAFVCVRVVHILRANFHFPRMALLRIVFLHTQFPLFHFSFSSSVHSIFEHIFSLLIFNFLLCVRLPHSCSEQTTIYFYYYSLVRVRSHALFCVRSAVITHVVMSFCLRFHYAIEKSKQKTNIKVLKHMRAAPSLIMPE